MRNKNKWFLLYTKSKQEKRAKENLKNQGYEVFLPLISYEKPHDKESNLVEIMFPCYLFIRLKLGKDNWSKIRSTRGVNHLVMFGHKPAEVSNQVIEFLKERVDKNDTARQEIERQEYQQNDKIVIKEGPLEGFEATFLSTKSKERVNVLLNLVNQLIIAEIPTSYAGYKEDLQKFKLQ
mgnify:CR=1 FL=1